jgi:hypothetical protein
VWYVSDLASCKTYHSATFSTEYVIVTALGAMKILTYVTAILYLLPSCYKDIFVPSTYMRYHTRTVLPHGISLA